MIDQLAIKEDINQEWISNVHPVDWQNPTVNGRYNLVVIGGGSAGLITAAGAAGLGAKVALIEKHYLGGDCLNVGCVPSKAVIRSAKVIGEIGRAHKFGIEVPDGTRANFGDVMNRMRRVRMDISHHDSAHRYTNELDVEVFFGTAKFTGKNTIEVGGQTLEFKKAVIATGSRPFVLPIKGLEESGYLTNENIWELTEQPENMVVVGGGPIGAELAQAFQRLGTQIEIFDIAPQLLTREDEEAAAIVQKELVADGVNLHLEANIKEVTVENGRKCVTFEQNGETKRVYTDEILLAVGRRPNVEGLGLETAGVEYNKKGLVVNDRLQTSNPNIFGAGDVAMKYQFTHMADAAARIVIQNTLFLGRKKLSDLTVPWVTYTDPEVAHVGMYESDAKEQGIAVDTYTSYFKDTDRGRADGESDGFVKVHVKKGTDTILGATIVGTHAGELISEITLAMVAGAGLKTLNEVIHPYPTQAEAIRKVAGAYNRTRLTPFVKSLFEKWMSWTR